MLPLIKTSLKHKRTALYAYSLGGLATIVMYVAIYPSLQSQLGTYNQLIKSLPAGLLKAFGADTSLTNFAGLLGTKQYGFVWPLLCILFMVSYGGAALSGEIEKSTIGLWLAAPISRYRVYWTKFLASLFALLVFVVLTVTAVIPVAWLFKVSVSSKDILLLSLMAYLFGACITCMGFLSSSIFSEKSKSYGGAGGVLIIMYILNLLAALSTQLINAKYLSVFYYFDSNDMLAGKPVHLLNVAVLIGLGAICTLAGAYIFNKRDISI